MIKYVLFDLDGTLTDPSLGITNSVQYTLRKFGINVEDRKELYCCIGPPLKQIFHDKWGLTFDECDKSIDYFHEYFEPKGMFENVIYDGITEMLQELKQQGKRIILATSKPDIFAIEILKHFDIYKYFDFIGGNTINETRQRKSEVIEYIFENNKQMNSENSIMIGDRLYDIEASKQFGMQSVGVLYGFGSFDELSKAGATYIIKTVGELKEFLLNS